MSRRTFYEPVDINALSGDDLHCVLLLASVNVPAELISQWTEIECVLAYDWAMREHLRASDNLVRSRPCPYFVASADEGMP